MGNWQMQEESVCNLKTAGQKATSESEQMTGGQWQHFVS